MKKWVVLLLIVALSLVPITAMAKVDMELFDRAKAALSYISYGEYTEALKQMGLDSSKAAAKKLKSAVSESLSSALYGEAQTDIALCYRVEKGYKLCVPVENPSFGGVEALVMLSKDGQSFGGYRAQMWDDCLSEAQASTELVWCDAIADVTPVIIAD